MGFRQAVERALDRKGLKKADLARTLGITPQALNGWFAKGNPQQKTVERIATALGVTPGSLMNDGGEPTALPYTPCEIPLYGAITAGSGATGLEGQVVGTIAVTEEERRTGVFAIRVVGDSMAPQIMNGDIALFEPVNGTPPKAGAICAVAVEGWKTWAIKEVSLDPRGWVILRSLNPGFPPIEVNPETEPVTIKGKLYRTIRNWRHVKEDEASPYRVKKK